MSILNVFKFLIQCSEKPGPSGPGGKEDGPQGPCLQHNAMHHDSSRRT